MLHSYIHQSEPVYDRQKYHFTINFILILFSLFIDGNQYHPVQITLRQLANFSNIK